MKHTILCLHLPFTFVGGLVHVHHKQLEVSQKEQIIASKHETRHKKLITKNLEATIPQISLQ